MPRRRGQGTGRGGDLWRTPALLGGLWRTPPLQAPRIGPLSPWLPTSWADSATGREVEQDRHEQHPAGRPTLPLAPLGFCSFRNMGCVARRHSLRLRRDRWPDGWPTKCWLALLPRQPAWGGWEACKPGLLCMGGRGASDAGTSHTSSQQREERGLGSESSALGDFGKVA